MTGCNQYTSSDTDYSSLSSRIPLRSILLAGDDLYCDSISDLNITLCGGANTRTRKTLLGNPCHFLLLPYTDCSFLTTERSMASRNPEQSC